MKKFSVFAICLMFLCCSFLFVGCNDKNHNGLNEYEKQGFVAVYQVRYSTSETSSITTLNSVYKINFSDPQPISSAEFMELSYKRYYSSSKDVIPQSKICPYSASEIVKVSDDINSCYTLKIESIEEYFLYVKIKNQNQIEIIETYNNSRYLISTTFYKIEYFS